MLRYRDVPSTHPGGQIPRDHLKYPERHKPFSKARLQLNPVLLRTVLLSAQHRIVTGRILPNMVPQLARLPQTNLLRNPKVTSTDSRPFIDWRMLEPRTR